MSGVWVGAATLGAGALSYLGNREASSNALDAQRQATEAANALQLQMYNQNRQDLQPWRQAGIGALGALRQGLGLGNPNYDQVVQQQQVAASPQAQEVMGAMVDGKFYTADQANQMGGYAGAIARANLKPYYQTADGNISATKPQPMPANTMVKMQAPDAGQAAAPGPMDAKAAMGDYAGVSPNEWTRKFSMQDFQEDPGYQYRLEQGRKALEGSAAARGMLSSGRTMKDLVRFGQEYGSQEYGNAFNRYAAERDAAFNKYAGLAGIGQSSTGQAIQLGANMANQQAANISGMGNAAAANYIAGQNSMNNLLGQGVMSMALMRRK